MVVTFTPAQPHGIAGPGIPFNLSVSPPPLNPGHFAVVFSTTPLPGLITWIEQFPWSFSGQQQLLGTGTTVSVTASTVPAMSQLEDPVSVTSELFDQGGTRIDQGTQDVTWDPSSGLGALQLQKQGSGSGGFNATDRQNLTDTAASTVEDQLLDTLTLLELSPGPTTAPVNAFLPDSTWGILVRLTAIPSELVPGTPDGDYWMPTLAVVRIFRGSDLWMRVPIHTSNRIVSLFSSSIVSAVTLLTATQWLLNMSVQVSFHPGVFGQVYKMRLP